MLKKSIILTALAFGSLLASAADYTVYNNGQLSANLNYYGWWNDAVNFTADNPDGDGSVFEFKAANGGTDASMGLYLNGEPYTGPLHSATLNFSWYAKGTGTYTVRLTAQTEQNCSFVVTESDLNKWNTVSWNILEKYPTVAQEWNDYVMNGVGYVFSVVLADGTSDSDIYFSNIYYSDIDESWTAPEVAELAAPTTVPTPTQSSSDVISIFGSTYPQAVTFNIGGWGQSTQASIVSIDGKEVYKMENFNYLGWELTQHIDVSEMTYMHVDFWTPNEGATFGFTPISPGQEKAYVASEVKTEEWNSYDVALTYWDNVVFSDLFQIKFDQGNGSLTGYITNVYFYKNEGGNDGDEEEEDDPKPTTGGSGATYSATVSDTYTQTMNEESKDYPYSLNYSVTWNEDKTLSIKADYDWDNGEPVGIVAGSVFVDNVLTDFTLTDRVREATTAATFAENQTVSLNFYIPVANGVVQNQVQYIVGTDNSGNDTSIGEISVRPSDGTVYDLQGRRVANPGHGLYIINGVKVLR